LCSHNIQEDEQEALLCRQTARRDASVKSICQLLHAGTTCTSLEQIEVMELKGYSQPTYNKLVHLATTHSTVVGVIHKLTDDDYC